MCELQAVDLGALHHAAKMALLINLYNLVVACVGRVDVLVLVRSTHVNMALLTSRCSNL